MTHSVAPTPSLDGLRVEIDRIDTALHGLLMERAEIIDRLIAVKARQGGGSAFRPGREADMMRRLVARHTGILPLETVESIWRIIISTFTYVQAPYSVHADSVGGDATMRDSCRFHFGFTVPLATYHGPQAVIAAVAAAGGDLGLVKAEGPTSIAWWEALKPATAPKIIARLPFVERAGQPAGLPLFVVAKPLADAAVSDVCLYAVDGGAPPLGPDVEMIASFGPAMLVSVPGSMGIEAVAAACGQPVSALTWVGSHARRFEIDAAQSLAAQ